MTKNGSYSLSGRTNNFVIFINVCRLRKYTLLVEMKNKTVMITITRNNKDNNDGNEKNNDNSSCITAIIWIR